MSGDLYIANLEDWTLAVIKGVSAESDHKLSQWKFEHCSPAPLLYSELNIFKI